MISATTPGLGGLGDLGDWWTQPIVFEKLAVWTLLWEVLGLGAGSMPLSFRFVPPIGGVLYWLRPGTVRLPPWPGPGAAHARARGARAFDVALYAGRARHRRSTCCSPRGVGLPAATSPPGGSTRAASPSCSASSPLLGLRDKVSFLGARPEIYATMLADRLPLPGRPVDRRLAVRLHLHLVGRGVLEAEPPLPVRRHGDDQQHALEPIEGGQAQALARLPRGHAALAARRHRRPPRHRAWSSRCRCSCSSVDDGTVRTIAVVGMILFHLHITSTFPLAVPLEWNIFMIFGILFLFGHYGDVPLSTLDDPLLIAMLAIVCVGLPVLGNFRPDQVSFLPSMRYYAGNWATSQWLFRKGSGAEAKLDDAIDEAGADRRRAARQDLRPARLAEFLLNKGLAFRSMHSHGRALNGLLPHAVDDVEAYDVREGELISGVVNGWNFGDGHFHDRAAAGGGPGALRLRAGRGAGGDARVRGRPAASASTTAIYDAADGPDRGGLRRRSPTWSSASRGSTSRGTFPVEVTAASRRPAPAPVA